MGLTHIFEGVGAGLLGRLGGHRLVGSMCVGDFNKLRMGLIGIVWLSEIWKKVVRDGLLCNCRQNCKFFHDTNCDALQDKSTKNVASK